MPCKSVEQCCTMPAETKPSNIVITYLGFIHAFFALRSKIHLQSGTFKHAFNLQSLHWVGFIFVFFLYRFS